MLDYLCFQNGIKNIFNDKIDIANTIEFLIVSYSRCLILVIKPLSKTYP